MNNTMIFSTVRKSKEYTRKNTYKHLSFRLRGQNLFLYHLNSSYTYTPKTLW